MKKWFLFFVAINLSISCKDMILGDEPSNNPEAIFETLWRDFDEHYALFTVKNVNWDSLYRVYRPQVSVDISRDSLWNIITSMLEHLKDRHTGIWLPGGTVDDYFTSGDSVRIQAKTEFTVFIAENYLDRGTIETPGYITYTLLYAKVNQRNIGYVYFEYFTEASYNINLIDKIINEVSKYGAIILDIRSNWGGSAGYAERLAGRFVDNDEVICYIQSRNGPGHDDFTPRVGVSNKGLGGKNIFKGPVIVLTDRGTVSAGELLLLSLKTCGNVVQIGDYTAGCFSTSSMYRFLPNGWMYGYSIEKVTMPDGSILEGTGIAPDIFIKNDSDELYDTQRDMVMEKALEYLMDNYSL